jgi:transcriptional regulator with XRE-family HTH domain
MKRNEFLEKRRTEVSLESKVFVEFMYEVVDRIHQILLEDGMSQKELASKLGKRESEVSKWLSGEHNLTVKSLLKMEAVLGKPIVRVVNKID